MLHTHDGGSIPSPSTIYFKLRVCYTELMKKLEPFYTRSDDGPMHTWFGLTYSSYLVLPRPLVQCMPTRWQKQLVKLLNEIQNDMADHIERYEDDYIVLLRSKLSDGEYDEFCQLYYHDNYADYRHSPDYLKIALDTEDKNDQVYKDARSKLSLKLKIHIAYHQWKTVIQLVYIPRIKNKVANLLHKLK